MEDRQKRQKHQKRQFDGPLCSRNSSFLAVMVLRCRETSRCDLWALHQVDKVDGDGSGRKDSQDVLGFSVAALLLFHQSSAYTPVLFQVLLRFC